MKNSTMLSVMVAQIYNPTNTLQRFFLFHIFTFLVLLVPVLTGVK